MIRSEVHRFGPTRQALGLAAAAIIAGALALTSGARPASAAPPDILLQAPLVGQLFTPPDSADSGSWDCLPASLTMAISILDQSPADYGSVRRYMRTQSGIRLFGLGQTYGVVEYSTGGRFSADKTYHPVAPDSWRVLLEGELSQGRPLVLYIADASKLEDSAGQAPRPANESFTLAHAVLAVGLLNGGNTVVIDDPWNATPGGPGRQLRMTADAFATAWGNTRFRDGTVYSNAGWNYIGFQSASATGVTPEVTPTPASELITPMPAQTATPTPTPQGPPAAPTGISGSNEPTFYKDQNDPRWFWCPDENSPGRCVTIHLQWQEAATGVTGYRIYYQTCYFDLGGSGEVCNSPVALVATLDAGTTTYSADVVTNDAKWFVAAFNDAGESPRIQALAIGFGY